MDKKNIQFQKRILETFRIEAEEHLDAFSVGLKELAKNQTGERLAEIIESMFREIHSLKGAARSIDQKEVESVCQPLESVFSALKFKSISLSSSSFDLFHKTSERLHKLIFESGVGLTVAERHSQRELIGQLREIAAGPLIASLIEEPKAESEIPKNIRFVAAETVRIRTSKLDPLLLQAEELIQAKKAINQHINDLQEINTCIAEFKAESLKYEGPFSIISSQLSYDENQGIGVYLNKLEKQISELKHSMERDQYSLDSMVDTHLEAMRQILMLPVSTLVETFPGMVREISREQNKEIEFVIRGSELEIDKRILDELKDPLIHLIRNSIDHGIERPEVRVLQNKPPQGNITLAFTARENGMIEITLADDGNGISKEQVLKAAVKSGTLTKEASEKVEPEKILSLIFQSGVSTSSIITDISGRGLGLSIVREKTEKLNGRVSVETEPNAGTTFHILMPIKLATLRGILIIVKECMLIIPTMNVERVMKVDQKEIKTIENQETLLIDDQIISLVDLGKVLELTEYKPAGSAKTKTELADAGQICIVVLISGEHRMAFRVDDLIDEQQVLVKVLGKLLSRVKNISGATILGSGKVVPVLNIPDLMKSAIRIKGRKTEVTGSDSFIPKTGKILVAEDSITSRTLIKNILETTGYQVTTSIDGADALAKARSGNFDLVVSDVDMPKMNGFELTEKIRSDKKLSAMPVVLLTSLGSREDREHGIEVGADAYIIKSSFDQANLLEIIRKLI